MALLTGRDAFAGKTVVEVWNKVVHDDPTGFITVTDANEPSRSTSFSRWGFLFEDALHDPDMTEVGVRYKTRLP